MANPPDLADPTRDDGGKTLGRSVGRVEPSTAGNPAILGCRPWTGGIATPPRDGCALISISARFAYSSATGVVSVNLAVLPFPEPAQAVTTRGEVCSMERRRQGPFRRNLETVNAADAAQAGAAPRCISSHISDVRPHPSTSPEVVHNFLRGPRTQLAQILNTRARQQLLVDFSREHQARCACRSERSGVAEARPMAEQPVPPACTTSTTTRHPLLSIPRSGLAPAGTYQPGPLNVHYVKMNSKISHLPLVRAGLTRILRPALQQWQAR
jgi:hypothetical protein